MSKAVREKPVSDPYMLGLDAPAKKNGTPKIEKTTEEKSDPFMLGVEVKKKETITPDSDISSDQDGIVSETGTEKTSQSQSIFTSSGKNDKQRYKAIEDASANDLIDDYKSMTFEASKNPFNVVGNTKKHKDYVQTREGKVGKIANDILTNGEFNKEDIDYLVKVAPNAAKQIIASVLPDSTPQNVLSPENINTFIDQGKKIVDKGITESKVNASKKVYEEANVSLAELGVNPENLKNDQYAAHINSGVIAQRNKELADLEKQYPVRAVKKVSGRTGYTRNERENPREYEAKKDELERKYADVQNKIGISKSFEFAKNNPTLAPIEIGEQWLKYADPDTYKLWLKGGKKGAINRDMAEIGVRALYASGLPGTVELAKADEINLDNQYPDKIISETYHRLGAELYKGQNWLMNAAPGVNQLDEAAKQLPEKNREVYQKFIREKERRNIGTDAPMSGLLNKVGEGFASTATEAWKGLGDLVGARSDKKVASEALNEGIDTDFQDVGTYAPAKGRLKEINNKTKKGETLTPDEIIEKQDLETFTGVRSTGQEIIDGTGNLTGQVVFQILGTKGVGAAAGAGAKGLGLLRSTAPLSGLATEEAIAARSLDFGISNPLITDISAMAVAYASSYDAAKREAFRLMPDDEDAGKRTLYATIVGGLNAGTERIFKDEKVLNAFNKEISPNIKSLVTKLSNGEISKEALSSEISKILKNSAAFGKEMTKANLKESTEELVTSVGQSTATAILAPTKFNEQQAFDDAVSTFTTTFLHGGLVSAAAGINGYRASHISIPTIAKLGIDQKLTDDTRSFINAQVLSGNMTQEEANGKFRILNTASKINTEVMPQIGEIAPELPQKAKEKYSVQLLNEKILTAQAEETKDPVLQSALEEKVKESEKMRKQILNKEVFVDDDYSVVGEAQINAVNPEDALTPEEVVVRYAKDGKLSVYSQMVNDDPKLAIDVLRDVAQQVYGINDKGEPLEGGGRSGALSLQFSTDILEAAEKQFPTPESTLIINNKTTTNESEISTEEIGQEVGEKETSDGGQQGNEGTIQEDVSKEGAVKAAPIPNESESQPTKSLFEYQETLRTEEGSDGDHDVITYDLNRGGEMIGEVEVHKYKDKGHRFSSVELNNEFRGKGIGKEVYRDANERSLKESGYPLWTKKAELNENSARVWESLIKNGEAEILPNGNYQFKKPANVKSKEGQSTISKPKVRVSAEQLEQSQPKKEAQSSGKKKPTRKDLSDQLRGLLGNNPLALDTDPLDRVSFGDVGIKEGDTIGEIVDKLIAYNGLFTPIFDIIKNDPYLSNVKPELVKSLPGNESGLYYPIGHGEGKDGLLQIADKGNVYYTIAHELEHFYTLDSKRAEEVKDTAPYKAIEDIFNFISSNKEKPVAVAGNVSTKNYGLTNVKEFMAEMFINPTFRQYVSDVYAKNKDEIFKQSKVLKDSRKGGSIIDIIADLFRELFSKVFSSKDSSIPYDEQKSVIDNAVKLATDLFFGGQDVTKGQVAGEGGALVGMGEQRAAALALPSGLDPIINEFVKASLAQGATPEDVIGSLIDNGFTEEEAQSYIDNNPPAPPDSEENEVSEGDEEKPSGIRKALVSNQIIADVNLDRISDKAMIDLGRKILETGEVKPEALVNRIVKERVGVLTPAEVVGLITYKADLDNQLRDALKNYNERQGTGQDLGTLGVEIADLEQKIDNFDVAAVITANQQSMAFRLRQYMLDRDYNVTTQIEKYKKNNNGYIPPEVEAKFRELDRELKAVKEKLSKAEKKLSEKESQQAVDNIKEDVDREKTKLSITEDEIQQKIKEGVQKEIDAIHSRLPKEKQSIANKAIKALDNFQKKLRGKNYADVTGMIAIVDSGITVIKNAIKAGVAVADAVELGISRIKELLAGKGVATWAKEDEFRKDALEGFESEGIPTTKEKGVASINDDGSVSIPNSMLRDFVERGITEIEELTDAVHEQVVKDIPDITKRQVRDYITDYGRTINPTADDIQQQVNTAKRIGRLLSELEDLQNKKRKDKNPSSRAKFTERERELKRKIRALDKSLPLNPEKTEAKQKKGLQAAKERVRNQITDLEQRIKNKDFAKKKKVEPAKDEELLKLEAEKEKLQEQFDVEQYKQELKNRTFWKKAEDFLLELTSGLVRGLVASFDLSAGLVQGLWRLFSNPVNSAKAFGTMFKHLVSEKGSKEYMTKLKTSPAYNLMIASKLAIDDKDGKQSAKEGLFVSNWVNLLYNFMAKVLTLGYQPATNFLKKINPYEASKRAFDGYVNSIRVQSFTELATRLKDKGYTYESDPEVYKKAADFVNTTTGRASLGAIENNSKWLNIFLFAPRKVAAEAKLFTPYAFAYYAKMPPAVRKRALLNLAKFLPSFLSVNALLWAATKDDEDEDYNFWNPNSSDFLTHKLGNKRLSIAGGMKSMIVMQSRLLTGKFTDQYGNTTKLGERPGKQINSRLDLLWRFILGKASPAIGAAAKKLDERKGLEVDDAEMIKDLTVPIWMQDLKELYKDSPAEVSSILMALSFFGANIRTVEPKKGVFSKEELGSPEFKYFTDRGALIPAGNPDKIEIADEETGKIKKLSEYGEEKIQEYQDTRKDILKEELITLRDNGYVFVDKFGRASINNEDGDKEETSLDELTEDQWKQVMSILGGKATKKTKEELFPK
jgi:hypothetical protein